MRRKRGNFATFVDTLAVVLATLAWMNSKLEVLTRGETMRHVAACVVLVCCVQCQAGSISGVFHGIANIEIQQFVRGQQVGPTSSYEAMPSTLSFAITADTNPGGGPFQFSLTNSVFSLDSATLPDLFLSRPLYLITAITDGLPGQSADSAFASINTSVYHYWWLQAGVRLTDPTGQYIGPNGNGDPSGALVTAEYVYQPWDSQDTGQTYRVTFTTDPPSSPAAIVPEPSSVVIMAIGLLAILFRIG